MGLTFTMYVVAHSVLSDLQDEAGLEIVVGRFRQAHVGKVALESYRGGVSVEERVLRNARDALSKEGFQTMGGLMPVHGEGFAKRSEGIETRLPFFCYSSQETVERLEQEIRKLARLFNEVVIDDAFMTSCRCAACKEARGSKDWPTFRRDLLSEVAHRWVAAAHEENPRVCLIVKFPQTYDRYQQFGYDTQRFPEIFDGVWVGTETRDPDTAAFGYTEPYQGYFNMLWMRTCADQKFTGAWFDYLDCNDQQFYEQAVTTCLGEPAEITLFCYGKDIFDQNRIPRLVAGLPHLERLREVVTAPHGVYVYKPPNSEGGRDLFIFDYLGMMGIPCVPTTSLRPDMKSVIVPGHGVTDASTAHIIANIIASGGQVIVTHQALERLCAYPSVLELFGYAAADVAPNSIEILRFSLDERILEPYRPIPAGGDLDPNSEVRVRIWAHYDAWGSETRLPFATVRDHASGGRAAVWNLRTFAHDAYTIREHLCVPVRCGLLDLSDAVIGALRNMATEPLGYTVEAPPRMATFLFDRHVVFVNYADTPATISATGLSLRPDTLLSDKSETVFSGNTVQLPPRSHVIIALQTD